MSGNSPEIDCNCDNKTDASMRGILEPMIYECDDCGKLWQLVGTNKEDLEWEEVSKDKRR
jgi:hypothetical protein